jgi:hypothetical protein
MSSAIATETEILGEVRAVSFNITFEGEASVPESL